MTRIAVVGEFDPSFPPHQATVAACAHSAAQLDADVEMRWISTADASVEAMRDYSAIWVAPGSPYRSLANALAVIRHAREEGVPCFGTCGGCQHMVLEYARNVLGFRDAQHAEYDPYASELFVTPLECSLVGREMRVSLVAGSRVATIYGATEAQEQYYCNFGIDPEKTQLLRSGPLRITGSDAEGDVRVVELPDHPFFIATLFVPQLRSAAERPHPLVTAFVAAAVEALTDTTHRRIL